MTPVTILAEELGELLRRIDLVPEVNEDLRHRLRRARDLAARLDPYVSRCATPQSPALAALARRTHENDWDDVSANGSAISTFNAALADDPRVEQVLVPVRDGVTLIRRVPRKSPR